MDSGKWKKALGIHPPCFLPSAVKQVLRIQGLIGDSQTRAEHCWGNRGAGRFIRGSYKMINDVCGLFQNVLETFVFAFIQSNRNPSLMLYTEWTDFHSV